MPRGDYETSKATQSVTKNSSVSKKEFDFTETNLHLVESLLAKGYSYKKIAKELSKTYVTARKHKRLNAQTIANLLQSYRNPRTPKTVHYTDSNEVHNPKSEPAKAEAKAPASKLKSVQADILDIMKSNLSDDLKNKCVTWALNT